MTKKNPNKYFIRKCIIATIIGALLIVWGQLIGVFMVWSANIINGSL